MKSYALYVTVMFSMTLKD